MDKRVALYTFGIFIEAADHPNNDGFSQRNDPILLLVESVAGFIARSGYQDETEFDHQRWGEEVYPSFYHERGDGWSPATLSLWQDVETLMAFSYFGLHAEAMSHGREWFRKPQWPPYVAWWVDGSHTPDWKEAVERHQHLHDSGSTAFAFNFKQSFDAKGQNHSIDRAKLKAIVEKNKARHGNLHEQ